MSHSEKPDLKENTNVRTAHRDVDREAAAVAREFSVRENGLEPVSGKLIVVFAIIALLAGGILFKDTIFNYGEFPTDYRRGVDPNSVVKGPPIGTAYDAYMSKGEALYSGNCASCHGGDANGTGVIPPLAGSEWVNDNDTHLLAIAVNGLSGEIEVKGKKYSGQMPVIAASWSDYELAALSTFVKNSFGNHCNDKITGKLQIKDLRERLKLRKAAGVKEAVSANELKTAAYFAGDLKGEKMDKEIKVNKKTGDPVE